MNPGFELPYPKSFLKLLLIAFAVVASPLIFAIVSAAVHVERLAEQSRTVVVQAAQAARGSRLLAEEVTNLERVVRQFLILGDTALLQDYERLRGRFHATTSELSLLPLDEAQLQELNRTIEKEQGLFELLRQGAKSGVPARAAQQELIAGYIELSDLVRGIVDISNTLIDREIERLQADAGRAQQTLWWQLLATLPAGLLLAVGVTILVARPIRQLDRAIRALGAGELVQRIRVGGPADLVHLGDRLDWLRRRLMEVEDQKQRFLRHVSHELKTPLTSLREGADLLGDGTAGELSPAQRDIVSILMRQSAELQRLIGDLLDYQRAQDGLSRLNLAEVDLDRVVKEVAADHSLVASSRGVSLEMQLEPLRLRGDEEKLRVVIDNLVSNAVKYSPDGCRVSLRLRRDASNACLDVRDVGPGIPDAERHRVFDWFFQGGRPHQGRVQGSGLGLAIARDLVLAHGGRIEVLDTAEAGAHFRVLLPLAAN